MLSSEYQISPTGIYGVSVGDYVMTDSGPQPVKSFELLPNGWVWIIKFESGSAGCFLDTDKVPVVTNYKPATDGQ